MDGIDDLIDELEQLKKNAQEVGGEHEIPFDELFPREFMIRFSDSETIEEFFDRSPWEPETPDEFEAIPETVLDEYVDEHSRFRTWENMMGEAVEEWVGRQLNS